MEPRDAATEDWLVHANCVAIRNNGILIRGASGLGKTAFSLTLIRRALNAGLDATLVADDQTLLGVSPDRRLVARCPDQIKGLVEVRPYGIVPHGLADKSQVELGLVVDLLADAAAVPRLQDGDMTTIAEIDVPWLRLQMQPGGAEAAAVFVALGFACWY